MPMPWVLRGLRNGVLTTRWPRAEDPYFSGFPGSIAVRDQSMPEDADDAERIARICPTGAIQAAPGSVLLDRGKCILCGRCAAQRPEIFAWAPGSAVARTDREALVVGDVAETDQALDAVRRELAHRVRRLRRSVHIRHVDTGSDGSEEWEIQALLNPVYDVHRLGIFFTASPRHADLLLVTGIGAAGMTAPLRRTREGMPDPVVVIAAGTDAISGGLVGGGYTSGAGIAQLLPVDVWVPGSPPSPFSLLHGILLALGRLTAAGAPR